MQVGRFVGAKLAKKRRDLGKVCICLITFLLVWWLFLSGDTFEQKVEDVETAIILIDRKCLESIEHNLSCHGPLEVAVSASFSSYHHILPNQFNIKYKMYTSTPQNYILFESVEVFRTNKTKPERRAIPKHITFKIASVPIANHQSQLLLIPNDLVEFQFHWRHSRFIQCLDLSMKRKESDRVIPLNKVHLFEKVFNYLDDKGRAAYLMSGSLLGWYRECSLIPHTQDLDFAIKSESVDEELVSDIESDFEMKHKLGYINDTLELAFYADDDGPSIDLFTMYKYNETFEYFTVFDFEIYASSQCLYPEIAQICTGDLHGLLVKVPCNVEDVLKAEYGESWSLDVPTDKYDYLGARNVHPFYNYTATEFNQLFVRYENGIRVQMTTTMSPIAKIIEKDLKVEVERPNEEVVVKNPSYDDPQRVHIPDKDILL